jgi:hypothetical protein
VAALSGGQKALLIEALTAAYPDYDSLDMLFGLHLDRPLANYAAEGPLRQVVFKVIKAAEAQGWTDQLITGAALGNPGNPQLRELIAGGLLNRDMAVRTALAEPSGPVQELLPQSGILGHGVGAELERVVKVAVGFQNVVVYASKLLEQAGRVCCVSAVSNTGVPSSGTGFLVGPDLVLTNHHVLGDVIEGSGSSSGVRCEFDYHLDADGTVSRGEPLRLADDWLVAASPPSPVDSQTHPVDLPRTDQLDYALIRLAGEPGQAQLPDGRRRGWIDLLAPPPVVKPGTPLLIVQHPAGYPMQLAIDTDGVLAVNGNDTRLTYGVNTLGGSSGSPCFTFDLQLAAVHHAGAKAPHLERNEGIPIAAIAAHLRAGGHAATLGG